LFIADHFSLQAKTNPLSELCIFTFLKTLLSTEKSEILKQSSSAMKAFSATAQTFVSFSTGRKRFLLRFFLSAPLGRLDDRATTVNLFFSLEAEADFLVVKLQYPGEAETYGNSLPHSRPHHRNLFAVQYA